MSDPNKDNEKGEFKGGGIDHDTSMDHWVNAGGPDPMESSSDNDSSDGGDRGYPGGTTASEWGLD
jgi:hypothetical protein